jgi:hypothetical protein
MSLQDFRGAFVVALVGLIVAFVFGGPAGFLIAAILAVLEVSLSFDNAVVNAAVLQDMGPKWQKAFVTWGMLIAVVGMRLVFPILIVAIVAHMSMPAVIAMALHNPLQYAEHLKAAHVSIAAFGGMFLLLIFLNFIIDSDKDTHWIPFLEQPLCSLGNLDQIQTAIASAILLTTTQLIPVADRLETLVAGLSGMMIYMFVESASGAVDTGGALDAVRCAGVMGFLYLELLDASFSFDGVIGAFAVTRDITLIAIGLGIGAMFVRSMTISLVRTGTLKAYVFLEHGAHYSIGTLAILMLISINVDVPQMVTGLIGVVLISLALITSVVHNRRKQVDGALSPI